MVSVLIYSFLENFFLQKGPDLDPICCFCHLAGQTGLQEGIFIVHVLQSLIHGLEVLHGPILPAQFFPVAKKNDALNAL